MDRFKGESLPVLPLATPRAHLTPSPWCRPLRGRSVSNSTTPARLNHTNLTIGTSGAMLRNDRGVGGEFLICLSRFEPAVKTAYHAQRFVLV